MKWLSSKLRAQSLWEPVARAVHRCSKRLAMKSSDELGSSLTTLMQMRYATEAMIIGGTFICVSKAAEQEGCSQYLQNTLRQGGLFIASLSMLMLALAWRSEMVAAFAHLADWARRRRPVRAMSALGFVLIVAALVSGVAARFHGGPYPVSYTHLDVYKRQPVPTPNHPASCVGRDSALRRPVSWQAAQEAARRWMSVTSSAPI